MVEDKIVNKFRKKMDQLKKRLNDEVYHKRTHTELGLIGNVQESFKSNHSNN